MATTLTLIKKQYGKNNLTRPMTTGKNEGLLFDGEMRDKVVLPEQFFTVAMTARTESPELALLSAVLEDALQCYQRQWFSSSRTTKKLAREAAEYLFSDDTAWPCSFVNRCQLFSLSPSYIRSKLILLEAEQRKQPIHRKRNAGILRRPLSIAA